jgi:hypothetical protein
MPSVHNNNAISFWSSEFQNGISHRVAISNRKNKVLLELNFYDFVVYIG